MLVCLAGFAPAARAELLFAAEGNRLRVIDLDSLDAPPLRERVLVENARGDPERGHDINGMICALRDGSGRFVAGEDTGQPHSPAGWGVLDRDGTLVGKLVASAAAEVPDPYGCAFTEDGRLFTTELGHEGFRTANGQLLLWFPPFDRFPGPPGAYPDTDATSANFCKIATDIGIAGGIAIDPWGRVYVASASRFEVLRFSPPFPSSPDAKGGCGARDELGSPMAEKVRRERFTGPQLVNLLITYSGLAFAPNGNIYAASVATGRIGEFDIDGRLLRMVLVPSEWLPPFATGSPLGLAVDRQGSLYYADLDLVREGLSLRPGPNGKLRRIRFDGEGNPSPPEIVLEGLAFPDGLGILPGNPRDPGDLEGE
jgi:hypothetical protein